jgi:hypothetical protein
MRRHLTDRTADRGWRGPMQRRLGANSRHWPDHSNTLSARASSEGDTVRSVDGPKWTRSDAQQRPTGSKGGVAERRESSCRPRDRVHILTPTDAVEGVFTRGSNMHSFMPIFDVLYREFCRARLAEMRKQLRLWPGTAVVPGDNCEGGHPDDAADRGIDLRF